MLTLAFWVETSANLRIIIGGVAQMSLGPQMVEALRRCVYWYYLYLFQNMMRPKRILVIIMQKRCWKSFWLKISSAFKRKQLCSKPQKVLIYSKKHLNRVLSKTLLKNEDLLSWVPLTLCHQKLIDEFFET